MIGRGNDEKKKGGARVGAGRKPKHDESTITVSFRIPASKRDEVIKAVNAVVPVGRKKPSVLLVDIL